jgi:hypothetical protein
MAYLVTEANLSRAWLAAMDLMRKAGEAVNLNVAWQGGSTEEPAVRRELDRFLTDYPRAFGVETVADTLFPEAFYHPQLGKEEALSRIFELNNDAMRLHRRRKDPNDRETYFNRLANYPSAHGPFNQLEFVINRLKTKVGQARAVSGAYELGLSATAEMRVHAPGTDRNYMRFPCLSHISITLSGHHHKVINLTATYRNQTFISRAYGNYLGLSRLAEAIAHQTDGELGEIQCIATHASSEYGGYNKRPVRSLIDACQEELDA